MDSLWSSRDAAASVARYGARGVGADVALRVYSARLLGGDPRLVQHGGGNSSVKTVLPDLAGDAVAAMCVKGSGHDMASIEPEGFPAMRLAAVRPLAALEALSDEDMVNAQRRSLLDSTAPNPSVEALLHAFLPHKFIDHTHAWAVLALTDQPDGAARAAEVYGDRAAVVPYVMPGFALAKAAMAAHAACPDAEGLILLKHGLFTFGDSAEEAYERTVELVGLAEERIVAARRAVPAARAQNAPAPRARAAEIAPVLRGLAAGSPCGEPRRRLLDHCVTPEILAYIGGEEAARYTQAGVVTPDHAIRTKGRPLLAPAPGGDIEGFRARARKAFENFASEYRAYFARHNGRRGPPKTELDPAPRVILVPGVGLFGLGKSLRDARIAADLAEATVRVISDAEALGRFESIGEDDLFDIEYWSLEQAKLGKAAEPPLGGRAVIVTGGAGAIGRACVSAFAEAGAAVAAFDLDGDAAAAVEGAALGVACDVTSPDSVRAAFDETCERFGGVDIVVSNAGAAWQGRIGEVDDAVLRESFDLNFFAHQTVARNAVRVMRAQGAGGALLFNASKQALDPGRDFGPYGLPKAATLALSRQYALDYGREGIRANAVNADRIRSGLLTGETIAARAAARGVSETDYMQGNLLGREVLARDAAQAFVHLALAPKTTGAVLTVDGGNLAAAPR